MLYNGLGRYEEARVAAQQATRYHHELAVLHAGRWLSWSRRPPEAASPRSLPTRLGRLSQETSASGTDWALGIEARSRALLSEDEDAERLYREAIERLGRTRIRAELARAHLLYGEWLRREKPAGGCPRAAAYRPRDVRGDGHATRSPTAPRASCWPPARRSASGPPRRRDELTAQEAQIARLARDGLSNPEIGARLFISPRTVEYHLRKVFTKLDISSRNQLAGAIGGEAGATLPV